MEPERRSAGTLPTRRSQLHWPGDRRLKILSIDGGGIRGILPAAVLAEVEKRYLSGRSIAGYFDYVAGTSTGGIIALGLGLGHSAASILEFYLQYGAAIFPARADLSNYPGIEVVRNVRAFFRDLTRYKYERAPLKKALSTTFEDHLFGESDRRLVVPSFDGFGEVTVFKTPHHPDFRKDHLIPVVDIALATAAAPTFFSTFQSGDRQFADGGVWASNPVMLGLVDALTAYDVDRSNIDILSLGCADGEFVISPGQALHGGMWHWREIISAAMHLQAQNALGQAGLLIGRDRLVRIDHKPVGTPIPIDNFARCAAELPEVAQELVNSSGAKIAEVFLRELAPAYPAYYGPRASA